jgi:hypothetical protein
VVEVVSGPLVFDLTQSPTLGSRVDCDPRETSRNIVIPVPGVPQRTVRSATDWQLAGGLQPLLYGRLQLIVRGGGHRRLQLRMSLATLAGIPRAFQLTAKGPHLLPLANPYVLTLHPKWQSVYTFAIVVEIHPYHTGPTLPLLWTTGVTADIAIIEDGVAAVGRAKIRFNVAPVILPSSLDPVDQVLVVEAPATTELIRQLEPIVRMAGAQLVRVPASTSSDSDELDVWVRDAGLFAHVRPSPSETGRSEVVLIRGIRTSVDGLDPEPLDEVLARLAREMRALVLRPAEPSKGSGWVDWYGNVVASPPLRAANGMLYPYGRIVIGSKDARTISAEFLAFIDSQKQQSPPLVLDTSWLLDGHVDEVVTFVPCRVADHFRVLLPSVQLARRILMDLATQGQGSLAVFAGFPEETTVLELLHSVAESEETQRIGQAISSIREILKSELSMTDGQFIECPALFRNGVAVIPNAVNCLVCNDHVILPELFGPITDNGDLFQRPVEVALRRCGLWVHWLDEWVVLHRMQGEIHCGTNCISRP